MAYGDGKRANRARDSRYQSGPRVVSKGRSLSAIPKRGCSSIERTVCGWGIQRLHVVPEDGATSFRCGAVQSARWVSRAMRGYAGRGQGTDRDAGKTEPRAHTTRSGRGGSGVYRSNMAERHERIKRYSYSREVLAEFGRTQSDNGHRSSSRQRLGLEFARRSGVRSGSSRTVTTTAALPRRRCAALPRAIPRLCRNR